MSKEKLYFLEIVLPKEENEYLKNAAKKISNENEVGNPPDHDFHLTVEKPIYCSGGAIRVDLNKWLEMQSPFEFTLNRVDSFRYKRKGLMYLTMENEDEKNQVKDLHYNIHKIIKSNNPNDQNNFDYIPHVTLLKNVSMERIDELRIKFLEEIKPLKINVSEILVRGKDNNNKWQDLKRINLGESPIFSDQVC